MDYVREYLYFYPENVLRTYIHVNYLVLVCFFLKIIRYNIETIYLFGMVMYHMCEEALNSSILLFNRCIIFLKSWAPKNSNMLNIFKNKSSVYVALCFDLLPTVHHAARYPATSV